MRFMIGMPGSLVVCSGEVSLTMAPGATGSRMSSNPSADRIGVVTGASSGIGLYTALGLARTGMRVVMVGRDRARTEAARRFVAERCGSDRTAIALADFSSLIHVRRLADEILST